MEERQVRASDREQSGGGVKRRGLIAGVAVMAAGLLARQPAQTVEAESGNGPDGALILGSNAEFNRPNRATQQTELFVTLQRPDYPGFSASLIGDPPNHPNACGVAGNADGNDGVQGFTNSANGVHGIAAFADGIGVFGENQDNGGAPGGIGVKGLGGANGQGVVGETVGGGGTGVYGSSDTDVGVEGVSFRLWGVHGGSTSSIGIKGDSTDGVAVQGDSQHFVGVAGFTTSDNRNTAGVYASGTNGYGLYSTSDRSCAVFGTSAHSTGVQGESGATFGVYGRSPNGVGVFGTSANQIGVYGQASTPAALAGFFSGAVTVHGDFAITGGKFAAVPFPDGNLHGLYCVESPEPWFQDFGRGTLAKGRAVVKVDPHFAAVSRMHDYFVFVTGHDKESEGLVVTEQRADAFVVEEKRKGASDGTFSYTLFARRKDIKGDRFPLITLPKPAPQIDDPATVMLPAVQRPKTPPVPKPAAPTQPRAKR